MKCPACGAKNPDGSDSCRKCGAKLISAEKNASLSDNPYHQYSSDLEIRISTTTEEKADRQKASKRRWYLGTGIIVLFLLLLLFGYLFLRQQHTAQSYAAQFVDAYIEEDYYSMLCLLDVPDGDFLTTDSYTAALSSYDLPDIAEYTLTEQSTDDASVVSFLVTYTSESGTSGTYTLRLEKQSEKELLLFDTWRVDPEDLLVEDYSISVTRSASLVIDGTKVRDTATLFVSDEVVYARYDLDLFIGTYELAVYVSDELVYSGAFTVGGDVTELSLIDVLPAETDEESYEDEEDEEEYEETTAEDEEAEEESEYILPESSERLLTEDDIEGMTAQELNYAKNEIYARHGRMFSSEELQTYFESQSWYEALYEPEEFDALDLLSDIEKQNAEFLKDAVTAAGGYTPQ